MADRLFKGGEFLVTDGSLDELFTPEDFTNEQRQIAKTTEQFVADEVLPLREEIEHQDFAKVVQLMRRCGELGLLMIDVPEEYGGLELDKTTSMLAAEKIAVSGSFSVVYAAHTGIGTLPLVYYGTKEQKERYLQKILSGEWIAAYCLTEPDSGSDALSAKASATLSGDGKYYLLNGTKQFTTNGSIAELYTIFAKVDREKFTAFLVERSTEGLSVGTEEKKLGIKGTSTTQIILDNAKVPVENVLGEIGKGHKIAFNVLNVGRLKLGAAVVGAAKCALREGIRYANVRKQFGRPIASFGAIKEKLADRMADIFAAESLVYRLTGLIDDRIAAIPREEPDYYLSYQRAIEEYAIECAIAKVFCSEVLADVADDVVQIFGGYGFIQDYPAEAFYRDERINRIFEGTNEINRLLIPGILLERALKGEIPLQREAMKALDALMMPSFEEPDHSDPLFAERRAAVNLKQAFLVVAGTAAQRFLERIREEQELLLALADMAINIFALESALLRGEKFLLRGRGSKEATVIAAVKVFCFQANEKIATAARKAALYAAEGDTLAVLLTGIRRLTKYQPDGLLQAKRTLADAALDAERYFF